MPPSRLLQITVALGALVPILAGLAGIVCGGTMSGDDLTLPLSLDSHFHYLSGLLLGIGLGFWSCIPDITHKTERFQLLSLIVVVGGLARLYALVHSGVPNGGMMFGLGMELLVTPGLAWWQRRIATACTR